MSPPSMVRPVGVALATPSTPSTASTASPIWASVTWPSSLCTSSVVGASSPAGNDCSRSLKPSTLSTDFLKNVVVE